MEKETTGTVISVTKQWWLKVNRKPVRTHAMDGAAEALNSFVPEKERKSFVEAYDAARKKTVSYIRASDTTENSKKQDI